MKPELRQQLHQLRNELAALRDALQDEEGYLLEFQWDGDHNDGQLEGTPAGLIQMAMLLIDLAAKEAKGAHVHFDEYTNFGEGSDAIIAFKYRPESESRDKDARNNSAL